MTFIPVLQFSLVNKEQLFRCIENYSNFDAAILSSSQVVVAIENASHHVNIQPWRNKKWYVVGQKTKAALEKLFQNDGMDIVCGNNADQLVEKIGIHKNVLVFTGNRSLPTIPDSLRLKNVSYLKIIVYETCLQTPDLSSIEDSHDVFLCFFSPSGVECVESQICSNYQKSTFAAIGKTTAKALENKNVTIMVAKEPNAEGLLEVVRCRS